MSVRRSSKIKDIIYELDNADLSEDDLDLDRDRDRDQAQPQRGDQPDHKKPVLSVTFNEHKSFRLLLPALDHALKQTAQNAGYRDVTTQTFGRQLLLYATFPDDHAPKPSNNNGGCEDIEVKIENSDDSSSFFFEDIAPLECSVKQEFPNYYKKYNILDINSNSDREVEIPQQISRRSMVCFNCDGDHPLKDCPKTKNYGRINKMRNNFKKQPKRYHLDDENKIVGKDGGFIPGRISAELREALGLKKNQLPHHIYQMRILGYPPGWLLHAKITHSGLNIFDSSGEKMPDPNTEDGEIEIEGAKDKYDIKKIYDFPGFNVPASSRYVDESEMLGFPPMSEIHSKRLLIERLAPRKAEAYKKKKLSLQISKEDKHPEDVTEHADMDVDSGDMDPAPAFCFVPPLPTEDQAPPPIPPPEEAPPLPIDVKPKVHEELEETPDVESLDSLELKKQELLAALNEPGEVQSLGLETPGRMKYGTVRDSLPGTPLLTNLSPFGRLPSNSHFAKDICDVINFENLPNATGKYEKMSSIIKKVRTTIEQLPRDEDII